MREGGCSLIPIVSLGLYVEPVIHPKPGAVTALEAHGDKDVYDFLSNASLVEYSLLESCRRGSIGAGLRAYRVMVSKLGLKTNIALGSLMLLAPIASVLRDLAGAPVREILEGAHRLVLEKTGKEEALEYYALLEYFSPSHLGKYYGPVPGVGSGSPNSLLEVLRAASWDMVHGELLKGYPITMEALKVIRESPGGLREKALKTLLTILSRHGDTLLASKYGFTAYRIARLEAERALKEADFSLYEAVERLDKLWRPRGWNPGAALDIIATAIGLYNYEKTC